MSSDSLEKGYNPAGIEKKWYEQWEKQTERLRSFFIKDVLNHFNFQKVVAGSERSQLLFAPLKSPR